MKYFRGAGVFVRNGLLIARKIAVYDRSAVIHRRRRDELTVVGAAYMDFVCVDAG